MANIQSVNLEGKVTGQFRMTSLAAAVPVAGVGNKVILQAETQSVRIRYGDAPTTSNGLLLAAGAIYEITLGPDQSIQDIQVIETAASAILNVIAISTK